MKRAFRMESPIGALNAVFEDEVLVSLSLGAGPSVRTGPFGPIAELEEYVERYFSGEDPGGPPVPIDLGAPKTFKGRVLRELINVGYGEVVTYKGLAERIGSPGAARAVGGAVGSNPYLIIVPCHRVVGSGHGGRAVLGGFSAGLGVKRALLRLEGRMDIAG